MPDEDLYLQQLNEDRARQAQMESQDRARQTEGSKVEPVSFPWLILCVAVIFDLIGFIPIVNIFSEILAGLIFWLWKKTYDSKTNPLIDIVAVKIVDLIFMGALPSNTATVVYAYSKKKTASKAQTAMGGKIIAKIAA